MVMKKPVVKAKPARSAARETARPKAVAKKSAPAPAKKIVPAKALRTQTGVKATAKAVAKPAAVPAKPLPTVPAASSGEALRGRPGRKPKQSEEQLMGGADAAVPEAGDDTADPSVQIVEKMSATKLRAKDRRAKEKSAERGARAQLPRHRRRPRGASQQAEGADQAGQGTRLPHVRRDQRSPA